MIDDEEQERIDDEEQERLDDEEQERLDDQISVKEEIDIEYCDMES